MPQQFAGERLTDCTWGQGDRDVIPPDDGVAVASLDREPLSPTCLARTVRDVLGNVSARKKGG